MLLWPFLENIVSHSVLTGGRMFPLPGTAEAEGIRISGCREFKLLVQPGPVRSRLLPQPVESSGKALQLKLC